MTDIAVREQEGGTEERVAPVNKPENRKLYAKRVKIHPRHVTGTFRRLKWTLLAVLLAIYYVAPWLRWDRGPNAPDQAILVDFPARKFYFFFIEIWPQEVYYLTGILVMMAMGLFLFTSTVGRVWCGYGCPQTVWTDLFIWVERLVEGDRGARIRLDAAPWTPAKVGKRVLKHAVWLLIAAATGGAWVFYFADAPTLARDLLLLQAPPAAWITIAFLTGSTYTLAGFAREQVCIYMCPYARFQAAMLDEHSVIVTYRADRGEPRAKYRKGESWEGRGDCVDCGACVAVCPTGIDIRDGQQLECINCGLCIDACDEVMDRIGRPRGLIALDTLANVEARKAGLTPHLRIIRPRTIVYAAIWAGVGLVMLVSLLLRPTLEVSILRDRNPLFVTLSDGSIRNGYTLRILNKTHEGRDYVVDLVGIDGAEVSAVGAAAEEAGRPVVRVGPDAVGTFRVLVQAPRASLRHEATDVTFVLRDRATQATASHDSVFRGPGK